MKFDWFQSNRLASIGGGEDTIMPQSAWRQKCAIDQGRPLIWGERHAGHAGVDAS